MNGAKNLKLLLASEIVNAALSLIHHVFASFVMEAEEGPLDCMRVQRW